MEPDFLFIMIPYLAEVIAADMPYNVRSIVLTNNVRRYGLFHAAFFSTVSLGNLRDAVSNC